MRNHFATTFWKNALESLPSSVRARYAADFEAAERWELRVGSLIEAWSRLKNATARTAPKSPAPKKTRTAHNIPRSAH